MNIKSTAGIFVAVVIVGVGAAFTLSNSDDGAEDMPKTYTPNRAEVHEAVLARLAEYPEVVKIETAFLSIGAGEDAKTWSVRGTFDKENRNIPMFASVEHTCDGDNVSLPCWRLNELVVDGTAVTITGNLMDAGKIPSSSNRAAPAGDTATNSVNQQSGSARQELLNSSTSEAGNAAAKQMAAKAQPSAAPEAPEDDDVVALERETVVQARAPQTNAKLWRTRSDSVNARATPSLEGDVVFNMSTSVPLTLINEEKPWGLFEYPSVNGQTGRVWIHLSVVEPADE